MPALAARSAPPLLGLALLATISIIWGVNWPVMKIALAEFPIWAFRAICLGVGGVGLLAIARLKGIPLRLPRRLLWPTVLVSFFNITVWHLMSAAGVAAMASGRAAIIAFTMPLWAALLAAPLLGERMSKSTGLGLAVGLAGMAALMLPDAGAIVADPAGPAFMLAAAIAWAVGTVAYKYVRWPVSALVMAGWQQVIGGIPIFIGAPIFDWNADFSSIGAAAWLATLFAATLPMIVCHWAWFHVVGTFPAIVAAVGTLAIPVIGVLSSSIALGEPLGPDVLGALLLVVAALVIVVILPLLRRRMARAAAT
jgi:drug/metabolite transporter (DMT)-like permease